MLSMLTKDLLLHMPTATKVYVSYVGSNKKLSYRRETARQLPTWRGLGPPAHSPPPPLATPMRMVEFESHNVRTSSVPSTKRTLR